MDNATLKGIRRVTVIITIAAFAISAAIGIYVLVAGTYNDTFGKVLSTTAITGAASVSILCHLAIVGRAIRVVGFVGIAASVVAFGVAMVMVWVDWNDNWQAQGDWGKALAVSGILAVFLAQANLLLLLSTRQNKVIRITLFSTFGFMALVYLGVILLILTDGHIAEGWNESYSRMLGVFGILDALGTVLSPVLGLVLKSKEPAVSATPTGAAITRVSVDLTPDQVDRLKAAHPGIPLDDALRAMLNS